MASGSSSSATGKRYGSRSFPADLHALLEAGHRDLHWDSNLDGHFRISTDDARALAALNQSGEWYTQMSSFNRQLSYYGFKRAHYSRVPSDASPPYRTLTHESGLFREGDRSQLHLIARKPRPRNPDGIPRLSPPREKATVEEQSDDSDEMEEEHSVEREPSQPQAGSHGGGRRFLSFVSPRPAPSTAYGEPPKADPPSRRHSWSKDFPPLPPLPPITQPISAWDLLSSLYSTGVPAPSQLFSDAFPDGSSPNLEGSFPKNLKADVFFNSWDDGYCYLPVGRGGSSFTAPSPAESSSGSSDDSTSSSSLSHSEQRHHYYSPPPQAAHTPEIYPELHHPRPIATSAMTTYCDYSFHAD